MGADRWAGFSASAGADGIVTVGGELDLATAPLLEQALRDALSATSGDLVVDLAGVAFMDSAGMNVFVRMYKVLAPEGRSLSLVNASRPVRRALEVGGAGSFAELR